MVETVRDHRVQGPRRRPGRPFYSWILSFRTDPELDALYAGYQPLIRELPGLTPVSRQWLHVVIQDVGYADRVRQDDLDPIIEAVRARLVDLPAFELRIEPARVGPVSLRLPVRPLQPLRHLRVHLRTAILSHWGPETLPEYPDLDPSVALGYWNRVAPMAPLRARIAAAEPLPVATTRVTTVSLVNLFQFGHEYEWVPYASLRLAS